MFHFSITDLMLFSAIADEQNLTKGAFRIHLSTPAASIRIKRLEDAFHVRLLNRLPRGIELTPAGKIVDRYAKRVLQNLDEMSREIAPFECLEMGVLRIVSNYGGIVDYLPADVSRFIEKFPTVRVQLDQKLSEDVVQMVSTGKADIGVSAYVGSYPDCQFFPYHEDELVIAIPSNHPLGSKNIVDFSEILDYEFVALNRHSAMQVFLYEQAKKLGNPITPKIEVDNPLILMKLVSKGIGIGILSHRTFETLVPKTNVHMLRLSNTWAKRHLRIVLPSSQSNHNIWNLKFVEMVKNQNCN